VTLATVSSDAGFRRDVRAALDGRLQFEAALDLSYEDAARLRGIPSEEKCIVIVDFADPLRALGAARVAQGRPHSAAIAVGGGGNREELLELMQAGIRDVVPNFTYREVWQAVNRAASNLACAGESLADLYAFVPAKPGCGATTLATNATAAAARLAGEPTLLLDFDLRLGVTSFLLKAEGGHTIVDALAQAGRLDRDLWRTLVSQIGNLHLLGSGPMDFSRPFSAESFTELLNFAMRRYSVVAVDLPGSMEDHECEALLRAKKIFLVCTPDIGALHVARRKASWLSDLRLTSKVSVALNCMGSRSTLSVGDIERIIQMPITYLVPDGAKEVMRAAQNGTPIGGGSPLAKEIAKIAAEMTGTRQISKATNPVRRFVEYFSISAARETRGHHD
jgi:pilus assembly protein CpaE